MQLLGLPKLEDFKKKHAATRGPLDAWRLDVEAAQWDTPHDVKQSDSSASILGNNRVVFNIKGNAYRIVVKIGFQNKIVLIEWIGTHAQYSKLDLTE